MKIYEDKRNNARSGSRSYSVGRRIAKMWNNSVRGFPCKACGANAGSHEELMNHYRNRHPDYFATVDKKKKTAESEEAA